MPKTQKESDNKAVLDVLLLGMPGVVEGKMFGYAAYYTKGKLFACVYGDGAGVKVPEDVASALLKEDYIIPFQPFGRQKMRAWIQINRAAPQDYQQDVDIFRTSIEFVSQLPAAKRKMT